MVLKQLLRVIAIVHAMTESLAFPNLTLHPQSLSLLHTQPQRRALEQIGH